MRDALRVTYGVPRALVSVRDDVGDGFLRFYFYGGYTA